MTSKERAALRAKANGLEPIIQLGKEGISENLPKLMIHLIPENLLKSGFTLNLHLKHQRNLHKSLQLRSVPRLFRL